MGQILHIFIAPQRDAPMVELSTAEALADCGLHGDRYAEPGNRKTADYQLTAQRTYPRFRCQLLRGGMIWVGDNLGGGA